MIYRKRKKFNDVKRYIKTINPNLPGQKTQKEYFKEAILEWQQAGYLSIDIQAWNVYASTKKVTTSGFNMFTRLKINTEKEEKTFTILKNCEIYDVYNKGFKVDVNVESDLSGILYLGSSKFSMLREFVGTFSVNKYTFTVTGLSELSKYYFYMKNTSAGESGRTGIFTVKTNEIIPVTLSIGAEAIDRATRPSYTTTTYIGKANPANESGKIKKIEIWAQADMTSVKVFTCFVVSGNNLSSRDYQSLPGTIVAGAKRTFDVDIDVVEGDYLGFFANGYIEMDGSGGSGAWYKKWWGTIPFVNTLFSVQWNNDFSIHGSG